MKTKKYFIKNKYLTTILNKYKKIIQRFFFCDILNFSEVYKILKKLYLHIYKEPSEGLKKLLVKKVIKHD